MADQEAYDDMFTHIASKAGGIKPLLDTFFSFLERKTDFYVQFDQPVGQAKANYKMGFPKGVAEKMVLQAFRQYKLQDYDTVMGSQSEQPATVPQSAPQTPSKTAAATQKLPVAPSTPPKTPSASQPPRTPTTSSQPSSFTPSYTPEGKQYPIGNGGIGENYYWTQTLKDVTVYIDTAAGCRGKDVKCEIKAQSLKVAIRGEVVVEGALEDVIRTQESMWTISSTTDSALQQIVITLDKTRPTWWKHVISTHEEIDTTKVTVRSLLFILTQRSGHLEITACHTSRQLYFKRVCIVLYCFIRWTQRRISESTTTTHKQPSARLCSTRSKRCSNVYCTRCAVLFAVAG